MFPNSNLLLASLSEADSAFLSPHLKSVHLAQQKVLFEAGATVDRVYFPSGAIISLVVTLSTGEAIEAAMVGKDGVVGAPAALDGKISLSRAIVQLSGDALTCELDVLKKAAMQEPTPARAADPARTDRLCAGAAIGRMQCNPQC